MRKTLSLLVISALTAGGVALYAQPAPSDPPLPAGSDADMPGSKEAQLTPDEMTSKTAELSGQSLGDLKRIEQLKAEARKKKDVIKLNCINDKLLQAKQLLNIIDDGSARLSAAISTGNESERYHRFAIVTISASKVHIVREEAEACIGEEISYVNGDQLDVDEPDLPDDPTVDDPFDGDEIEPPGYASPMT
jgi:hypothetical protein